MPTFRRTSLLIRAINSALGQTFADLEVIAVVDGDDPATVAALEAIPDPRLRFVVMSEKVGGSEARNVGAREARADWVALLDDDDEWLPEKLEKQMKAAEGSLNDRVLITCSYICRSEEQKDAIRPRRFPKQNEALTDYMFDFLCYFQTSTYLCPKKLFLEVPFDREAAFFQDIDWMLRLRNMPGFQLIIVPEALSIYHMPSSRPGITSALDWQSRLQWGKQRRHLMSKRAYSRFVVGSCVGRAVQEGGGIRAFEQLFFETTILGSPTPYLIILLCLGFLIPPEHRKRLRDMVYLARPKEMRPVTSRNEMHS